MTTDISQTKLISGTAGGHSVQCSVQNLMVIETFTNYAKLILLTLSDPSVDVRNGNQPHKNVALITKGKDKVCHTPLQCRCSVNLPFIGLQSGDG